MKADKLDLCDIVTLFDTFDIEGFQLISNAQNSKIECPDKKEFKLQDSMYHSDEFYLSYYPLLVTRIIDSMNEGYRDDIIENSIIQNSFGLQYENEDFYTEEYYCFDNCRVATIKHILKQLS